jgi:prepilin-type N-terminal cleavage/methylation domain-containing protein
MVTQLREKRVNSADIPSRHAICSLPPTMKGSHIRGVTLIEISIVVAIIALVSGGISIAVIKYWHEAQIHTTETNARAIRNAVKAFGCSSRSANRIANEIDHLAQRA